ncbi:MAG: hypothetical protein K2Y39_19275 [Candidatus Obscuribacterales bacterium]|nr:hypothetical protein [Candidatus Obscuribacterales bacterium]
MSFKRTAISLSILGFIAASAAFAEGENPKFEKAKTTAQAATDASEWKKAETNWGKCLDALEAQGEATPDANLELTLKRLAQACRQNGDYGDGMAYLQRAVDVAAKLSLSDPDLQTEANELGKFCRVIDPGKLGKDAEKLIRDNKATIIVVKDKDEGNFIVTVTIPNRIENNTGDDKVDQIAMEKIVTLNLNEGTDGTVAATNIKGFKIHVVEKKMWVNLLAAKFAKPNETGARDVAITAGKMGVTKTVTQSVDANFYQPVAAFVEETKLFGTPTDIATGATPATSATATSSTSSTSSTFQSTGSGTTVPAGGSTAVTSTTTTTTSAAEISVPATSVTPAATTTTTTTTTTSTLTPTTDSSTTSSASTATTAPADGAPQKTTEIETTTVIDFSQKKNSEEAPKVEEAKPPTNSSIQTEANGSSSAKSSTTKHDDDDDDDDDDDKDKKKRDRDDD